MVDVWRLTRPDYASDLTGEGNRKFGARWNSSGRAVLYTSAHLSLCVLEAFVHVPNSLRLALPAMTAVAVALPDDASSLGVNRADLPDDLYNDETAERCRTIGDSWLMEQKHLILTAPSLVVPQERNIMVNPAHPMMERVRILSTESFLFDPRLASTV
jgi:RES domain-containing protein